MTKKLNIAIILKEGCSYKWQSEIIDELCDNEFVSIKSVLLVENAKAKQLISLSTLLSKISHFFFFVHQRLDELLFSDNNSLMRFCKPKKWVKSIRKIDLSKSEISLETLFKHLDLVLMFDPIKLENEILDIPKYGIWDLTCHNVDLNIKCLPGYWELVDHAPELITNLEMLGADGQSKILYQSSQITDYFSIYKNQQNHLKRLKLITLRVIQKLSEQGESYFSDQLKLHNRALEEAKDGLLAMPDLFDSIKNQLLHIRFLIKDSFLKLIYSDYWFVLINTEKSIDAFGGFGEFKPIDSPKDRFWADPFVISRNARHYVFVEELLFELGRGRISCIEIGDNGEVLNSSIVLEKDYHMSYPLVFQHEGVDYMIPETKENKTIDLYRCQKFPDQWVFVRTLMTDVYAVDATPYYYEGKWWLFANLDKVDGNSSINDELYLFYSGDLFFGNWVSHPQNPIVSDVKLARPAGKIFEENGKIFRPSQDCSLRYGYALNINRITKLSEVEYEEVLERKIFPDWQPEIKRNHTINSSSKATVVDAFKVRNRFGV
jgi:hypothetical protein